MSGAFLAFALVALLVAGGRLLVRRLEPPKPAVKRRRRSLARIVPRAGGWPPVHQ